MSLQTAANASASDALLASVAASLPDTLLLYRIFEPTLSERPGRVAATRRQPTCCGSGSCGRPRPRACGLPRVSKGAGRSFSAIRHPASALIRRGIAPRRPGAPQTPLHTRRAASSSPRTAARRRRGRHYATYARASDTPRAWHLLNDSAVSAVGDFWDARLARMRRMGTQNAAAVRADVRA